MLKLWYPANLGQPIPRDPAAPIVRIDVEKLNARRATVRAMMAGRPGQRPKSKIADERMQGLGNGGRRGCVGLVLLPRLARKRNYVGACPVLPGHGSRARVCLPPREWLSETECGPVHG